VSIAAEFDHIQHWASLNQHNQNQSNSSPQIILPDIVISSPIASIEQVDCVKLLGIYFTDNLSFCPHVNHVLSALNQRGLGQLHRQGLAVRDLQTVFKSIILSKFLNACQSFSGSLYLSDIDGLQSF
jgi:hypothetical protein